MASTIFNALLPAVLTLLLGVFAGWQHDFDEPEASTFNRLVLRYALPLVLFTGILATPRSQFFGDVPLIVVVVSTMIAAYFIPLLIAHWVVGRDLMTSTLQALAIGGPSAAFVGLPVLGYLFGETAATIPIAVASLVISLVHIPVSIVLLSAGAAQSGDTTGPPKHLQDHIVDAFKQPMVWAPILATIFLAFAIPIPEAIRKSLALLGHATGGVALFASGVILYSRRVVFNLPVGVSVLSRNVIVPALVWALVVLLGLPAQAGREAVLTLALPSVVLCVVLAVHFRAAEQEMASVLFFTTILSLPTVGVFIWLLSL